MRRLLAVVMLSTAFASAAQLDPSAFRTNAAKFSVDVNVMPMSNAVATIQPHYAAGYSWVRIYFYSFPFTSVDVAGALKGDVSSMDRKWSKMSTKEYNNSRAVLQLTVDKDFKVWQVDLSLPGYTCSVASSESEAKAVLQDYGFEGKHLRLATKGSYTCGTKPVVLGWDVNLDAPVFQKASTAKK